MSYLLTKVCVDPFCVVEVVALVSVETVFKHDLEGHVKVGLTLLFPFDNLNFLLLLQPVGQLAGYVLLVNRTEDLKNVQDIIVTSGALESPSPPPTFLGLKSSNSDVIMTSSLNRAPSPWKFCLPS